VTRRFTGETAKRLRDAWRVRDAAALTAALHRRAVLTADGLSAETHAVRGGGAVATALLQLTAGLPEPGLELAEANGSPAIVLRSHGTVRGVVVLEVRRHAVTRVWAVFTPSKLSTWT